MGPPFPPEGPVGEVVVSATPSAVDSPALSGGGSGAVAVVGGTPASFTSPGSRGSSVSSVSAFHATPSSHSSVKSNMTALTVDEDDFVIGGQVLTTFGRGRILQIRSTERQIKVQVLPWKLAGDSKVLASIQSNQVLAVLSKCKATHMTLSQKKEYAHFLKRAAAAQNHAQRYGSALDLYRKTISVVTTLLQDTKPTAAKKSSSKLSAERADWLVTVVRCSNQASEICIRLDLFEDCMSLSRNAMIVLDALQGEQKVQKKEQQSSLKSPPTSPTDAAATTESGGSSSSKSEGKNDQGSVQKSDSGTVSSEDESRSVASLQQVGQVRLFGECRIQAFLHMATALLALGQAPACKKSCEQAQAVLVKYSGREYLERSEYKSTLKKLVGLQKQIKALKKQAKLVIKSGSTSSASEAAAQYTAAMRARGSPADLRTRKIRWFDDKRPSPSGGKKLEISKEEEHDDAGETQAASDAAASWFQSSQTLLTYGTIIVGTIVITSYILTRRRVR